MAFLIYQRDSSLFIFKMYIPYSYYVKIFYFYHPVRKTKAICSFRLRKENRWDYWISLILAALYSCSQQQSSRLFCCWCLTASPLFQFSFFSHKVMVTDSSYSVTLGSRLLLGEKYLDIAFDELLLKEELSRW